MRLFRLNVLAGATAGRTIATFYKAVAVLVLNFVVVAVCVELGALAVVRIVALIHTSPSDPASGGEGERESRETVSYYASQEWATTLWREFKLSRQQYYAPFVGWKRAPFKGQTINIDGQGLRVTPGADCGSNSYKVFMFGASTMWGTGSPDWGTIAAHLQADLHELKGGRICVMNFGESAYVSTQDVTTLMAQVRAGNVPDVAVFYDGPDDVYAAYQSGVAGVHENLEQTAARFNPPTTRRQRSLLDRLGFRDSSSYALIDLLMAKLTVEAPQPAESAQPPLINYATMGVDRRTLSNAIVSNYLGNYQIANALAKAYGFRTFFFWSPLISMGTKKLTGEEQKVRRALESDGDLNSLYASVYRSIEHESSVRPGLQYMAHVFDDVDSLLWIDEAHVTPVGNEILAREMLKVVEGRP